MSCVLIIVTCFLPWVYYEDIQKTFTGFYSYKNEYGKPGKLILSFGLIILLFMLLPRLWAKRVNLFLSALLLAYAFKTFILFGSCYNNYCPQKLAGLYLLMVTAVIILVAAVFPDIKMLEKKSK